MRLTPQLDWYVFVTIYLLSKNDNKVAMQSNVGSIGYQVDALNRVTGLSNSWGDSFIFNYDDASRLIQVARPGSFTNYTYSEGSALTNIDHFANSNTSSAIGFASYQYDQRNFPVQKRSPAGILNYGFDKNGQLTSQTEMNEQNSIVTSSPRNENFGYDEIGNRLTDKYGNYIYDNSGQKLIEDWQYSYHFDLNGNLVSKLSKDITKDSFNYSYSSKNQLIEVVQFGGYIFGSAKKRTVYFYDVLGRRMQKSVEDFTSRDENNNVVINSTAQRVFSRKYLYDGDNILAEYDGNNVALARYTHSPLRPDDILSAEITSSGVTAGLAQSAGKVYYLKDALGTVTDIVNASGSVVQRYEYETFGKIVNIKSGSGLDITNSPVVNTSFTFTGREWDEDAGLYYYRARYYDPSTGRFLQQDPEPGKLHVSISVINKYIYVANNPLMFTDSTGRDFMRDLGIAVVIVAAFASGAWVAGLAAGSLGFAAGTAGAMITGALVGAAVGGAVGAVAFPALGLGTSEQGFMIGAAAGGLGGFTKGAGWLGDYSVTQYKGDRLMSGIESGVNSSINSVASPGSTGANFVLPRGTEFAATLGAIEPYAIGIGGGLYLDNMVYQCSKGNCNIPTQSKEWSF